MVEGEQKCVLAGLYLRYFPELRGHLGRKLGSHQDADDLVQEVFLRVHQASSVGHLEHPRAYLYQVAHSVLADHFRRDHRRGLSGVELEPVDETQTPHMGPTPEEAAIGEEVLECVCRSIAGLPQRVRQAMMLRNFDGLSYREVADTMGISVRTVEKHLARAAVDLGKRVGVTASCR